MLKMQPKLIGYFLLAVISSLQRLQCMCMLKENITKTARRMLWGNEVSVLTCCSIEGRTGGTRHCV